MERQNLFFIWNLRFRGTIGRAVLYSISVPLAVSGTSCFAKFCSKARQGHNSEHYKFLRAALPTAARGFCMHACVCEEGRKNRAKIVWQACIMMNYEITKWLTIIFWPVSLQYFAWDSLARMAISPSPRHDAYGNHKHGRYFGVRCLKDIEHNACSLWVCTSGWAFVLTARANFLWPDTTLNKINKCCFSFFS